MSRGEVSLDVHELLKCGICVMNCVVHGSCYANNESSEEDRAENLICIVREIAVVKVVQIGGALVLFPH